MAFHCSFFFFFFFFLFLSSSFLKSLGGGFQLELIHRDSPSSPLYNASATSAERERDAAMRSLARLSRVSTSAESVILPNGGDYLVELLIGTPPTKISLVVDTGSHLIWTQCDPCTKCYHQQGALYDSRKSSTYMLVSCHDSLCESLQEKYCAVPRQECIYSYKYEDKSTSYGTLAKEEFALQTAEGPVAAASGIVFGCGEQNDLINPDGASGVLGLGSGVLSLVSQLGSQMEKKFSYCLPRSADYVGSLKLGLNTSVSGTRVVSTPLLLNDPPLNFYYVSLEGISVGGKRISYRQVDVSDFPMRNTVLDSGSTLNYIDPRLYNDVLSTLKESIGLQSVGVPPYDLCYKTRTFNRIPEQTMIFHFSGADVELKNMNMFTQVQDMMCFAMVSSKEFDYNLYGNVAQRDFEVEYNLDSKVVSFAQANCSQFSPRKAAGAKAYTLSLVPTFLCTMIVIIHVVDLKL